MFHCFIAYVIFILFSILLLLLFFFALSIERTCPDISLLITPCMIVYVTNNKEPWTLNNFKHILKYKTVKLYFGKN